MPSDEVVVSSDEFLKKLLAQQPVGWEISGSLVLSSPHHERTLAAAAGRRAKESGLFFKFLSDKT